MKKFIYTVMAVFALSLGSAERGASFEMTAAIQAELDRMKATIGSWAGDAVIVKAVAEHNLKGPIDGMDNAKWKSIRRSDDLVKAFQSNAAGKYLKAKLEGSGGKFTEAFLNGTQGEKVAFVEKTTSYIHKGQAKFDVPFGGSKSWQGKAEFDESAQTYQIQISVPVLDGGKTIGALVVGANLSQLEKIAKK